MNALWWEPPGYPGDRMLARVGDLTAGAVFPPVSGRNWRWRCWRGPTVHPSEGMEKSEHLAKRQVEIRVAEMIKQVGFVFDKAAS